MRDKLRELTEKAREHPGGAMLNVSLDMTGWVVHHQGTDYPITKIDASVHAVDTTAPLTCTHYELKSSEGGEPKLIHHLSAQIGGQTFQWVMPEGMKSKQIEFRFGPKSNSQEPAQRPNPKERAERRKKERKAKRNEVRP